MVSDARVANTSLLHVIHKLRYLAPLRHGLAWAESHVQDAVMVFTLERPNKLHTIISTVVTDSDKHVMDSGAAARLALTTGSFRILSH